MKCAHGNVFGRLTVLYTISGLGAARAIAKCECGSVRKYYPRNLEKGFTKSCGCYRSTITSARTRTHAMAGTPIYHLWRGMLQRCNNPKNTSFNGYGRRGITVCEEWKKFENFYRDMGDKPDGMSLDRKDNDLGYFKDNCRWADDETQANNKRNNRYITINGARLSLAQAARQFGVERQTITARLNSGWSAERAVFTDPKRYNDRASRNTTIQCACGCGGVTTRLDIKGRTRRFILGHNSVVYQRQQREMVAA